MDVLVEFEPDMRVHHLAHPGNLMRASAKNKKWHDKHEIWCESWKDGGTPNKSASGTRYDS